MIGSLNSTTSFTGLPKYLQRANIESLNARGLADVIKDAGLKAGIVIKTTPKRVFERNAIFNGAGQITPRGTKALTEAFGLEKGTCTELRDALAESYEGYNGDGILDQIV